MLRIYFLAKKNKMVQYKIKKSIGVVPTGYIRYSILKLLYYYSSWLQVCRSCMLCWGATNWHWDIYKTGDNKEQSKKVYPACLFSNAANTGSMQECFARNIKQNNCLFEPLTTGFTKWSRQPLYLFRILLPISLFTQQQALRAENNSQLTWPVNSRDLKEKLGGHGYAQHAVRRAGARSADHPAQSWAQQCHPSQHGHRTSAIGFCGIAATPG